MDEFSAGAPANINKFVNEEKSTEKKVVRCAPATNFLILQYI